MPNYKTRKDKRTTVSLRDDLHGKLRAAVFMAGPEMTMTIMLDEIVRSHFRRMAEAQASGD